MLLLAVSVRVSVRASVRVNVKARVDSWGTKRLDTRRLGYEMSGSQIKCHQNLITSGIH